MRALIVGIVGGLVFIGLMWFWHVITYPEVLKQGNRWWWVP